LYLHDSNVWAVLDVAGGNVAPDYRVVLLERLVRDKYSGFVLCTRGHCGRNYRGARFCVCRKGRGREDRESQKKAKALFHNKFSD
jgi:hypothetical protein